MAAGCSIFQTLRLVCVWINNETHTVSAIIFYVTKSNWKLPRKTPEKPLKPLLNWPLNLAKLLQQGVEAWQTSSSGSTAQHFYIFKAKLNSFSLLFYFCCIWCHIWQHGGSVFSTSGSKSSHSTGLNFSPCSCCVAFASSPHVCAGFFQVLWFSHCTNTLL